jgi:hypothetical protein
VREQREHEWEHGERRLDRAERHLEPGPVLAPDRHDVAHATPDQLLALVTLEVAGIPVRRDVATFTDVRRTVDRN